MDELVSSLEKRKKLAIYIVVLFAFIAIVVSYNFKISSPTYFDGKYNIYFANGLIFYKLIELSILYYFLFYKYLNKVRINNYKEKDFLKLKKHTKLLFFLIPQGNTIFGIIAYKLSSELIYFIIFSFIALFMLLFVKPNMLQKVLNSKA